MDTQYRTTSLIRAILFFFILFMTAGHSAQAACAHSTGGKAGAGLVAAADLCAGGHDYRDIEGENSRMDITVSCEWDDEGDRDGIRPDRVTVTLYANGLDTGRRVTLGEENGWSGCFEKMDARRNGETLSYSIVEERVDGYTGTIAGSDIEGYRIINIHKPLPAGRSGQGVITPDLSMSGKKGVVVETIVTTKVSKSVPARTSTATKKSGSAKTADASGTAVWELLILASCAGLYICMRSRKNKG